MSSDSISITAYPGASFGQCHVGLSAHVRLKLGKSEELTKETALRILKQIKWKSDVEEVFVRPAVLMALCIAAIVVTTIHIHSAGGALRVALRILRIVLGGYGMGFIVAASADGTLLNLSEALRKQSKRAAELIQQIEAQEAPIIRLSNRKD